ncbi:hypothetical protein [Pseudogracilibacillus auburnensis]|uniref:hypothetical protein n=1 Tax=Pseudogracilibacillus auburnensis TaxID=1494959 RepID=UPI001A95C973|nr:hypothetical protein [Pseudogracilibacillus auburnensis]MBO1003162.1 hypothetical protein [Pseudogracilibacillus auburnensis]
MQDENIALRYLFIDLAIKNLELDMKHIHNGPFKIKDPYMQFLEKMILKLINERRQLKKQMYQKRLQVNFLYKRGDYSTYKFIFNGKEKERSFMNHVLKKNVKEIIESLFKEGS